MLSVVGTILLKLLEVFTGIIVGVVTAIFATNYQMQRQQEEQQEKWFEEVYMLLTEIQRSWEWLHDRLVTPVKEKKDIIEYHEENLFGLWLRREPSIDQEIRHWFTRTINRLHYVTRLKDTVDEFHFKNEAKRMLDGVEELKERIEPHLKKSPEAYEPELN